MSPETHVSSARFSQCHLGKVEVPKDWSVWRSRAAAAGATALGEGSPRRDQQQCGMAGGLIWEGERVLNLGGIDIEIESQPKG